jgi:hypothetical protein
MPAWMVVALALGLLVAGALACAIGDRRRMRWSDALIVGAPVAAWLAWTVLAGEGEGTRWFGLVIALIVAGALAKWRGVPFL